MPSVNNMMKKFAQKGWVIYESYKPLLITSEGKKQAALVVRKHRLTEMFLVEKMNFGWENVHEIAEQLEHVQSEIFFDKMDELLNYPNYDPHGEPIPNKEGNIIERDLRTLSNCEEQETVKFKSVTVSDQAFLQFLNSKELELDEQLFIQHLEPYDASMTIKKENGQAVTLSKIVCDKILVK